MMKQICNILLLSALLNSSSVKGEPVKNCPQSCQCMLGLEYEGLLLSIADCVTEPSSELYTLLREHEDIKVLQVMNASLSKFGDISFLNNLVRLYLIQNNLTYFPCELSKAPNKLSKLFLSYNNIQTIDCDLSALGELKMLYLDHNNLKSMPRELSTLPNLSELHLSYNDIEVVDCGASEKEQLRNLYLDHNKLESVPCGLSKLRKLTVLNLAHNDIRAVDCDMSQLQLLYNLYLDNNRLSSVPCELSKLPKIHYLSLSHNYIQGVDCDISQLENLQHLDLDVNQLKSVPCELSKLTNLQALNLSNNLIKAVDCDMSQLKELVNLFMNNNKLRSVPHQLSNLPRLYIFQLSHNDIETLNCSMSHLPELCILRLDYNNLSAMPHELTKLHKLQDLSVSHNDIERVEYNISQLQSLEYLHLDHNKLESVPCQMSKLPLTLIELYLSNNNVHAIDCDVSKANVLEKLYLDHNQLTSVPCELANLTISFQLNLSHNHIQKIDCNLPKMMSHLTILDLSYNMLTVLPLFTGMQKVEVGSNTITKFTKSALVESSCENMPSYNLQRNNITHLMDIFLGWGLPVNDSKDFGLCINKVMFGFSDNPLDCDCIDYRIYHFLQKTGSPWNNLCKSPVRLEGKNPVSVPLDQLVCDVKEDCPRGCSCVAVPAVPTLRVSCAAYTGKVLPQKLPILENGNFYEFDIQKSQLESLPFRQYFLKTTRAMFSHNSITDVPVSTLKAFSKNLQKFHLNDNKLQCLPGEINTIEFNGLIELNLENNPWNCGDCQMLGLRDFITDNHHIIKNADLIKCHSPAEVLNRQVLDIDRYIFCHKEASNNTFSVTVTATMCSILLAVSIAICILKRRNVKQGVAVNIHRQNNEGDVDEDDGREFDIFVSYATEDEEYAGVWLIPELERRGFKVCFHRVHFLGGVPILVNMYECINKSKRMLAFFSENFVVSNYCMYEFDLALSLDIDGGTKKLVTIKEATLDINTLKPSYGSYFRTHTYIEQGAVNFWENLLETMPCNKLGVVAEPERNHQV